MHFPVPRVPQQPAPAPTGTDAGLSEELAPVVAGARRRAMRDGDPQIDTAHLLHSLVESGPDVRAAFGGPDQVARVLGYLVQRSIGYGLRWQATVEDSGAVPVVPGDRDPGRTGWSPSAAAAVLRARERAAERGEGRPDGLDLLAGLAADRDSRAAEVLVRAGVDPDRLAGRIGELSQQVRRT
ncbi:Clp protease N-terminal domain-containing protein [Streptomyces sp. WMMC940]|uniref:Clp protease N-terminal domain-containing protein n=1 Tax=Streptomyces sp. WMMC940 TaxID=3015153 RepID=UPI0022B63EF4|nr:Clp protease N-terminal domain-containing protein [Streptomyces sp. WMMC940]MCZ7461575.1 peptidase [Streptomyces sp. WMMC940]